MVPARSPGWPRSAGRASSLAALVLALLPRAAAADEWKFDVLRLKNGAVFKGLLVEENAAEVRFQNIRQRPGAPTVVIPTTTIPRREVARIERLDDRDRRVLVERLKALDPTGKGEAARMEDLELKSVPWLRPDGGDALSYASDYFVLTSNAREDIVRRSAVRLEQVYGAYVRFLPPRQRSAKPTPIYLVRSLAEYRSLVKDQGRSLLNPAFYDPAANQVVCASDLQQLGDDLERVRLKHKQLLDQLREQEQDLRRRFKGNVPAAILGQLQAKRREVHQANVKNEGIFQAATRHLFQTLSHEAFHAYLANFVYPPAEADVPRWLNEGLAQVFETALVEAGELRVGHLDPERLALVRAAAREGQLLPLADLLRSSPKEFLLAHAGDRQVSDRYYLNSWALATYLAFERDLLGTPALHRYVHDRKRGADELEAFRALVGVPLSRFDKDYRQYLLTVRSDGSTVRGEPHKNQNP